MNINTFPEQSELGKKTHYDSFYSPDKLFPILRQPKRDDIGIHAQLPFFGFDVWNHYEVSWLNEKGKPIVALAEIIYGCDSQYIIESKSMKLYFNSFNNTPFKDVETVKAIIERDLNGRLKGSLIEVRITPLSMLDEVPLEVRLPGIDLDTLDVACSVYHTQPDFLKTGNGWIEETVCSDLLKSNCLVTNQPDWCSVQIAYQGKPINHEGLLQYLVSFRNDNEFHEHCIEKIFMHILTRCNPEKLTVSGRSTRRGGLDINAIRSTESVALSSLVNVRLCRQ